jgi:hypothetical protein
MRLQHGGARGQAIPAVRVGAGAARAPPPPLLAAADLAQSGVRQAQRRGSERREMGERDGRERASRDERTAAARWSGCVASGQEGRGWRRPPRWRSPAAGRGRGGCAHGGRMHAAVGKENVAVFFIFFGETVSY